MSRLPVRSHADRSPRAHHTSYPVSVRRIKSGAGLPRTFGLGFLQTPPRGDALALLLAFGSTITWHEDSHLARSGPCLAHTSELTGAPVTAHPVKRLVMRNLFQLLFYVFVVS